MPAIVTSFLRKLPPRGWFFVQQPFFHEGNAGCVSIHVRQFVMTVDNQLLPPLEKS